MISIKTNNLANAVKRFEKAPEKVKTALKRTIQEGAGVTLNMVQDIITRGGYGARRAIDTGAMRNNMQMRAGASRAIIQTSSRTDYAFYVHEGTDPHDIPNAFGRGEDFVVKHPGTRANPFMTATRKKLNRNRTLEKILIKHLEKL